MAFPRTKKQDTFWQIVGEMEWKLDDGRGGNPPPDEPEFDHSGGGGSVWPKWATHVIAFMLGGLTWGALLLAPPLLPAVALCGLIAFVAWAYRHRWH